MTLLYFARHGETDDNARLVFQGQTGKGLNARGRAQARRLAERMKKGRITTIVASDLERAEETARIVGLACELVHSVDPDLREVDVGRWSGKSHEEIADLYPEGTSLTFDATRRPSRSASCARHTANFVLPVPNLPSTLLIAAC